MYAVSAVLAFEAFLAPQIGINRVSPSRDLSVTLGLVEGEAWCDLLCAAVILLCERLLLPALRFARRCQGVVFFIGTFVTLAL